MVMWTPRPACTSHAKYSKPSRAWRPGPVLIGWNCISKRASLSRKVGSTWSCTPSRAPCCSSPDKTCSGAASRTVSGSSRQCQCKLFQQWQRPTGISSTATSIALVPVLLLAPTRGAIGQPETYTWSGRTAIEVLLTANAVILEERRERAGSRRR